MDSFDGATASRRLVIDAEELGYPQPAGAGKGSNGKQAPRRHKRRKTNGKNTQSEQQQDAAGNIDGAETLSMEIQPLIKAAMAYGRKTHALGAMKAASALSSMVERLKALEVQPPGLTEIVQEAEVEATAIRALLCESYEA